MIRILVVSSIVSVIVGCALNEPVHHADWSARANAIAAQRLTDVGRALPAAQHRDDVGQVQPAGSGRNLPTKPTDWQTLPFARLAADVPTSQPATEPPPAAPSVERGPLPGFFDTLKRDLRAMPGELWHDTKAAYGDPLNLVFLLGAGGASAAFRPEVDDDIDDYYAEHHSMKEDWRDAFGAMGNPATHFAAAGLWYLAGQQLQHDKTYEVGKRMFSALTITGVTTVLLKTAACTESPNGENWAWPSGHVSSTMALATVLNDAYGPVVGIPMFGLTGLVGLERLDSGEHSFSDLVFGAALGWVVAETVMKEHRPEVFGGQIVPYVDPLNNHAGLAWVKPLGQR